MIKTVISVLLAAVVCLTTATAQDLKTPLGTAISAQSLEAFLIDQMQVTGTPGISFALINDGKIVYEKLAGMATASKKVSQATIFEGASISKPLFGYFVMKFVERGLLDLDKPLHKYLPYADIAHDQRYKKITARMVLSHQTGFPNWRTDTPGDSLFLDFEPGTGFQYSGEGYQYLALVLQELLNTNAEGLQQIFQKEVAEPLGLKTTRYIQDDANLKNKAFAFKNGGWLGKQDFGKDEFGAAYGIHSNARDFATWVIALMDRKGLTAASFDELFKNQVELPDDNPNKAAGVTHLSLGFYTGLLPFGQFYGHGGNNDKRFTCLFVFIPETKWGMVLFTNSGFGEQIGLNVFQYLATPN